MDLIVLSVDSFHESYQPTCNFLQFINHSKLQLIFWCLSLFEMFLISSFFWELNCIHDSKLSSHSENELFVRNVWWYGAWIYTSFSISYIFNLWNNILQFLWLWMDRKIKFYSHCFHNLLLLLVLRHTDSAVCVWESGLSSQKMSLWVTYWVMYLRGVIYVVTYVDISKLSLTFAWRRWNLLC